MRKRFIVALLAAAMLIAMPQASFADENDTQPEATANAKRTLEVEIPEDREKESNDQKTEEGQKVSSGMPV